MKYNYISDYFTDECRVQARRLDQPLSPYDYWNKNKDYVYQKAQEWYGETTDHTLREAIFRLAGEASEFRATLAVGFIKMFKARKILDPSMGWSSRLIGAIAMNVDVYVGVDPNPCLHTKYNEVIEFFGADKNRFITIQAPFETAKLPENITYDLILTSPPYFNLEVYNENDVNQSIQNRDLNAWFDDFLIASLNKAWDVLDRGGHMVIIINDLPNEVKYTELMIQVFNDLHDDAIWDGVISYTQLADGKPRQPQPAWIWTKM